MIISCYIPVFFMNAETLYIIIQLDWSTFSADGKIIHSVMYKKEVFNRQNK